MHFQLLGLSILGIQETQFLIWYCFIWPCVQGAADRHYMCIAHQSAKALHDS